MLLLTYFNSGYYVCFGNEHFPSSMRVSKDYALYNSLLKQPLFSFTEVITYLKRTYITPLGFFDA